MLKTFKKGGVHPPDNKISRNAAIETFPIPEIAYIYLNQHLGVPAKAVVQKGDKVKVGDLIAEASSFMSANIHSSVSGTVEKVDEWIDASGYKVPTVIIKVEGDEWNESIDRSPELISEIKLDKQQIVAKMKEMGIVGLGGAAFPTHVKYAIPEGKTAEYLIINGVECEPYLTSDYRLMMEHSDEIIVGIQIQMKALGTNQAFLGIENNKPEAIELLTEKASHVEGITVVPLKMKYPQGAEKQLIKAITGREVPSGRLPIDVGCVVDNVGTSYATYYAVQKNQPLFERIVTVTGYPVRKPSNFLVRTGTPISKLLEAVNPDYDNCGKVISGGPMMGKALVSLDVAVTKGTSGVLMMTKGESQRHEEQNCIRCGKCLDACPMGLEPYLIASYSKLQNWDKVEEAHVMDCIECGSCQFTCPSFRPLVDYIRVGKRTVGQIIRSRNIKK